MLEIGKKYRNIALPKYSTHNYTYIPRYELEDNVFLVEDDQNSFYFFNKYGEELHKTSNGFVLCPAFRILKEIQPEYRVATLDDAAKAIKNPMECVFCDGDWKELGKSMLVGGYSSGATFYFSLRDENSHYTFMRKYVKVLKETV